MWVNHPSQIILPLLQKKYIKVQTYKENYDRTDNAHDLNFFNLFYWNFNCLFSYWNIITLQINCNIVPKKNVPRWTRRYTANPSSSSKLKWFHLATESKEAYTKKKKTSILYMPIFPSNEDADITPGIFGYQWTSKFQLVPAGSSETIYKSQKLKAESRKQEVGKENNR